MAAPRDPVELLLAEGAAPEQATAIVAPLLGAGMSRPRIRAWLAHPRLAYPMLQATIEVAGEPFDVRNSPIFAVEEGRADLVVKLAEEFSATHPDRRAVALAFACTLETVDWMSHGNPHRLEMLARVTDVLAIKLRKNVHVADFAGWTLDDNFRHHFADRLAGDELPDVLLELEEGVIDPAAIRADPDFITSTWGP